MVALGGILMILPGFVVRRDRLRPDRCRASCAAWREGTPVTVRPTPGGAARRRQAQGACSTSTAAEWQSLDERR